MKNAGMGAVLCVLFNAGMSLGQCTCCAPGAGSVAFGTGSNLLTLNRGEMILDMQYQSWSLRALDWINPAYGSIADVKNVQVVNLGLAYGLSDRWTLSVQQPVVFLNAEVHAYTPDFEYTRNALNSGGAGDMSFLGTYRLPLRWKKFPQLALSAGLELPTGKVGDANSSISTAFGSASFDPLCAVQLKKAWKQIAVVAGTNYKWTTENRDGTDYGDFWSNTLAVEYTPLRKALREDSLATARNWLTTISLGASSAYLQQQHQHRSPVLNTGSTRLFGTLGVRLSAHRRFTLGLYADLPLYEKVRGQQNETDWRVRGTLQIKLIKKDKK